ncbi:NAD(P)/FAD-dependent oxidoreductase, partial [Marinobacter sp. VGCF2001]|uniref:NAD(P)/FAD-dependent oxidoreductase n=1 Tax=Marinobacter sp. VGCF2001 TaxID=3417189 RepID=UPI003CE83AF2
MSQEQFSTQTVVIGAGVVGLAIARALARSGREVLVLEAGARIGEGVSSRNSEVIHAGIYYPSDSLKARVCVAGRQRLYEFCASHKVAHRKCGKWIVASDEVQAGRLDDIQAGAASNGVALEAYDAAALSGRLPALRACRGLWSPETGIVDSHGLMLALLGDLEDAGGQLALNSPVVAAESGSQGHVLTVGEAGELLLGAREVINAAGLGAPRLAALWAGLPESGQPQQWLARGVYFSFSGKHPFDTLVYPLPEPGGLGIHLTLDLAGQARFGPDVEWVDGEGYQVDPRRARSFADSIRRWWPGLDASRLQPAYAGIRPKLVGPDGGFADFRIDGPAEHGVGGLVNLFGIESP